MGPAGVRASAELRRKQMIMILGRGVTERDRQRPCQQGVCLLDPAPSSQPWRSAAVEWVGPKPSSRVRC